MILWLGELFAVPLVHAFNAKKSGGHGQAAVHMPCPTVNKVSIEKFLTGGMAAQAKRAASSVLPWE